MAMGIGKKIFVVFGFDRLVASAVLLMVFIAPTASGLVFSGEVCIPGRSIKCLESDCGSYFVRCGEKAAEVVPAGKVCYQGALVPEDRTDLHFCSNIQIFNARNTTLLNPKLGSCSCAICEENYLCNCYCLEDGNEEVYCTGKNKYYNNMQTAICCGDSGCKVTTIWDKILSWPRYELLGLVSEQMEILADAFTFHSPPLPNIQSITCCYPGSGTCSNVC